MINGETEAAAHDAVDLGAGARAGERELGLVEIVAVFDPVADLVRDTEAKPALHLRVFDGVEALVDKDLARINEARAVDFRFVGKAGDAEQVVEVVEIDSKAEVTLGYGVDVNRRRKAYSALARVVFKQIYRVRFTMLRGHCTHHRRFPSI
jgi:hypothetical protein